MLCVNCGKTIADRAKFCVHCGESQITGNTQVMPEQQEQPEQPVYQTSWQMPVQQAVPDYSGVARPYQKPASLGVLFAVGSALMAVILVLELLLAVFYGDLIRNRVITAINQFTIIRLFYAIMAASAIVVVIGLFLSFARQRGGARVVCLIAALATGLFTLWQILFAILDHRRNVVTQQLFIRDDLLRLVYMYLPYLVDGLMFISLLVLGLVFFVRAKSGRRFLFLAAAILFTVVPILDITEFIPVLLNRPNPRGLSNLYFWFRGSPFFDSWLLLLRSLASAIGLLCLTSACFTKKQTTK